MKKIELNSDEIEQMNYNDVAFIVLKENDKKMKIIDLLNEVGKAMQLDEDECQAHITDFFELLSTDKRFIMLDDGYWDLKIKHNKGMQLDADDDDEEIILEDEEDPNEENDADENYDGTKADDDDVEDDDLSDLVIIDDIDEESGL